jgi:hypothetical protein
VSGYILLHPPVSLDYLLPPHVLIRRDLVLKLKEIVEELKLLLLWNSPIVLG